MDQKEKDCIFDIPLLFRDEEPRETDGDTRRIQENA